MPLTPEAALERQRAAAEPVVLETCEKIDRALTETWPGYGRLIVPDLGDLSETARRMIVLQYKLARWDAAFQPDNHGGFWLELQPREMK